jgi:hypothetical protein
MTYLTLGRWGSVIARTPTDSTLLADVTHGGLRFG